MLVNRAQQRNSRLQELAEMKSGQVVKRLPKMDKTVEPLIVKNLMKGEKIESFLIWGRGVKLSRIVAVTFGLLWGIDGFFKFQGALYTQIPGVIQQAGVGQPAFLNGWFSFWYGVVSYNPMLVTYGTGILELSIAFALIAGFARKIAYIGGIILGMFIWAVPEGFGGPYGPGSVTVGGGDIYALGLLFMIVLGATYGRDRYTLDYLIERRFSAWAAVAEVPRVHLDHIKGWFSRNSMKLSRGSAILFGLVYASESYLAFYFNLSGNIVSVVQDQASSAPLFLSGWFSFWEGQVTAAPAFYATLIGVLEALLAISLILGLGRKVAYLGGAAFAILAWGVGEGFGGTPVPGYTDPGTGIVQAIAFLILLGLNATHGTDPLTLDSRIETRFNWWKKVAEMSY